MLDNSSISVSGATVLVSVDGSFTYDPNSAFDNLAVGSTVIDQFQYTVVDGNGGSDSATVTVTIQGTNTDTGSIEILVADLGSDAVYRYGPDGSPIANSSLVQPVAARGMTTSAAIGRYYVLNDQTKEVHVYSSADNSQLGQWQFRAENGSTIRANEGIATDGNHVWIVSRSTDRIYRFDNAASALSGTLTADFSFALAASNAFPHGLETDGTSLWVVNDQAGQWKTFKYDTTGALLGSWNLATTNKNARGITIDPLNPTDLLVINDGNINVIYRYANATNVLSGSLATAETITLGSGNNSPHGIATVGSSVGNPPIGTIADTDAAANEVRLANFAVGQPVGITAHAADPGDTVTYQLTDSSNGRFTIDQSTGVVTVLEPDSSQFVAGSSYNITIQANSSDGSMSNATFSILIVDVFAPDKCSITGCRRFR